MDQQAEIARLRELTREKCLGTLTTDGHRELSRLLESHDDAATVYWEIVTLHAQLEWELSGGKAVEQAATREVHESSVTPEVTASIDDDLLSRAMDPEGIDGSRDRPERRSGAGRPAAGTLLGLLAIAAGLIFALVLHRNWQSQQGDAISDSVVQSPGAPLPLAPILGEMTALVPECRWSLRSARWEKRRRSTPGRHDLPGRGRRRAAVCQ